MLLIITNTADIHPNPVVEKLTQKGYPVFRLNTDKLIADYDISCQVDNEIFKFRIKYKDYPHEITNDTISCVWERRPMEPITTYDSFDDEKIREIVLKEADGFLEFFRRALVGMNLLWIGHPINERLGRSKLLQKMVARQLGFPFPKTVFSNVLSDIECFHNSPVALKPINNDNEQIGDEFLVFYTQKLKSAELQELGEASFKNTINFIEEYTEKQYELRTTVIDGEFFTAKICSQEQQIDEGAIDWRRGYAHGIKFVAFQTPEIIVEFCKKFLEYFNLRLGCFDFICTPDGQYVFLECNTNGQWLWLERDAGLQISDALVRTFIKAYEEHKKSI